MSKAVLFGEDGVAAGLRPGKLVIDMSSISPVATKDFAKPHRGAGLRLSGCARFPAARSAPRTPR